MMSDDGRELAFIVGHYKSGTTWLSNALSNHPSIRGLSEAHIFHYSLEWDIPTCTEKLFTLTAWSEGGLRNLPRQRLGQGWHAIQQLWKPTRRVHERPGTLLDFSVADQFALKRSLRRSVSKEDYCRRFFQFIYTRWQPRAYLLEKTPNNILYVPYIRSIFPKAKLLLTYRDGRDVVVSEKFMKLNLHKKEWNLEASINQWRQLIEAQFAYAEKYDIFTCSYESLLQDGEGCMAQILSFLDLSADKAVINEMLRSSSFEFLVGRKPGEENRHSFYRKGVSGDWQNHFSEEDKSTFKKLAGDLLIQLGYERDDHW